MTLAQKSGPNPTLTTHDLGPEIWTQSNLGPEIWIKKVDISATGIWYKGRFERFGFVETPGGIKLQHAHSVYGRFFKVPKGATLQVWEMQLTAV